MGLRRPCVDPTSRTRSRVDEGGQLTTRQRCAQKLRAPLTSRSKTASSSASTCCSARVGVEPGDLLARGIVRRRWSSGTPAPARRPCCSRTPSSAPCRRPGPGPRSGATRAMVSTGDVHELRLDPGRLPEPGVDLVPGRRVGAGDGEVLADRRRVPEQPDEGHREVVGVGQGPLGGAVAVHHHRLAGPHPGDVGPVPHGRQQRLVVRVRRPHDRGREARVAVGGDQQVLARRSCRGSTARTGCAAASTRSPAPGRAASGTPTPS